MMRKAQPRRRRGEFRAKRELSGNNETSPRSARQTTKQARFAFKMELPRLIFASHSTFHDRFLLEMQRRPPIKRNRKIAKIE